MEELKKNLETAIALVEGIERKMNTNGPFNFSEALYWMKLGKSLYRRGWNGIKMGKTMRVYLSEKPPEDTLPYFILDDWYISVPDGTKGEGLK